MTTMRSIMLGAILALAGFQAWAQAPNDNVVKCANLNDPDAMLSGCTAMIQDPKSAADQLPYYYVNRAVAYYDKGLEDQAIADFTKAISLKPDLDSAYFDRAIIYNKRKNYDLVIADLSKVIALQPDRVDAYLLRCGAYIQKSRYDEAIADSNRAMALKPDNAEAVFDRGFAYEMLNRRDEAIADYRQALKLDADKSDASTLLLATLALERLGVKP